MIRWRWKPGTRTEPFRKPRFSRILSTSRIFRHSAVDPSFLSDLPVLEWFLPIHRLPTRGREPGRRTHLGEFYDNVFAGPGGSSAGPAKKSRQTSTPHHFRATDRLDDVRAEEFNLNTTYSDKAYGRQPLTYKSTTAGSPGPSAS